MFYLFDLARNGKNYGSVDNATNNLNRTNAKNNTLGSPDDHEVALERGCHRATTNGNEQDPLLSFQDDEEDTTPHNYLLSIDDAINRLGTGRFHYQILVAAGLLMAADSIQNVLLSFLSKSQMESLVEGHGRATAEEASQFKDVADVTMVVFPGALMGALVLGILGDIIGRRPVFCYLTAPLIAVFGMGTAVVSASATLANEWLLLTSFLVAFGVGGLTVPFDTFSEVLSIRHRGRCLIFLQMFWSLGGLVVHMVLNILLLRTEKEDDYDKMKALFVMVPQLHATREDDEVAFSASWEWVALVVVCAIPCVCATILGLWAVPESPRFLVARGYPDQALDVLRRAAETNGDIGLTVYPLGTILYTSEHQQSLSSICNLCAPDWMKITSSLWATYFGLAFLDHGTMTLTVSVFSNDARQQDYQAIFRSTSELVGLCLALLVIDKWGRISTQRWSYMGGGAICVVVSLLISPTDDRNDNLLLVLAFLARMLVASGTAATWIATSEVLATEIRTSRHAIADAVGRLGGFVASYVFLQIASSLPFTGLVLFAVSLWTTLACGGLPETSTKEMGLAHIPVSVLQYHASRRRNRNKRNKQTDWLS